MAADALRLSALGRVFGTVLDCGLFHTFDSSERRDSVAGLASVTRPDGHVHVLCFSDADPSVPHPVGEGELRAAFARGWAVVFSPDRLVTRFAPAGVPG